MKMKIPTLERDQHLPSRVASSINREISSGRLQTGARLPTENEMAESFGVSRNVIREAVSQLRADGVIMARQGVGAFVMAPEKRSVIRIDPAALRDTEGMERFFELRNILETEAAGLAAERRSQGSLDLIRDALDRMSGNERWEEGSIDADLAFHREIAHATGNEFINTFISFICERIRQSIHYARETNPIDSLVETNLAEHAAIYEAIVSGDPDTARLAMRRYIIGAAERVGINMTRTLHDRPLLNETRKVN